MLASAAVLSALETPLRSTLQLGVQRICLKLCLLFLPQIRARAPKSTPRAVKRLPRAAQECPKGLQNRPKIIKKGPQATPGRPKTPPGAFKSAQEPRQSAPGRQKAPKRRPQRDHKSTKIDQNGVSRIASFPVGASKAILAKMCRFGKARPWKKHGFT